MTSSAVLYCKITLELYNEVDTRDISRLTWGFAAGLHANNEYGKCPKLSYTKFADKMSYANSIDPDQTAPEGAV